MIKIFFDFEVTEKQWRFSDKAQKAINLMREFVYDRVKILESQIINEPSGVIVINVMNTLNELNKDRKFELGMYYMGFSNGLRQKLSECVTESDGEYILKVIMDAIEKK